MNITKLSEIAGRVCWESEWLFGATQNSVNRLLSDDLWVECDTAWYCDGTVYIISPEIEGSLVLHREVLEFLLVDKEFQWKHTITTVDSAKMVQMTGKLTRKI